MKPKVNDMDGYTYELYEAEQERISRVRLREQQAWEQADEYKEDYDNEHPIRVNSRVYGSFADGRE